ncbi:carbohydrate ABC transporter permease [Paenibacillus sp. P25]|nr:carbohydrate ABC transporter permease [Paenibacillus sp. P25]
MKSLLSRTLFYLALAVAAILALFPLYFTVMSSFLTERESGGFPPVLFPKSLYLGNFIDVFRSVPIDRFLFNSFAMGIIITASHLITASLAAYAFAFVRVPGRRFWFILFLSTMMIPLEVTVIPNYLTIRSWGWTDTYQGLVAPYLATGFGTFLLRQYFLQSPTEIFEAARIDGYGHFRSFMTIALPLSRSALATLAIHSFLGAWNSYFWPLLITNQAKMRTVQIGIWMLQSENQMQWNLIFAGVTIVMFLPIVILLTGLKQLIGGLTAGAVKA